MMKICAVIAEYNPFHTGHALQIEYIRRHLPDTAVVAIMSGNIVQRGELALLDKYIRARTALLSGADAVLELPYPWCGGSAGYFARGGVEIAKGIGAHCLCFGSESGDIDELAAVAERTAAPAYLSLLDTLVSDEPESPYISLTRRAYKELYGTDMPEGANNTLAIEYLKNIGDIVPVTYKRTHPSSATAARGYYRRGDAEALRGTVPEAAYEIYRDNTPTSTSALDSVIMWRLRTADPAELCRYADIDMGIAVRMISAAGESVSAEELFSRCATKKYTNSRLRRCVLNVLLGTEKHMLDATPAFTVLLGANDVGRQVLKRVKKQQGIRIITKPADHGEVREQFELSNRADRLFATARGERASDIMKRMPVIL